MAKAGAVVAQAASSLSNLDPKFDRDDVVFGSAPFFCYAYLFNSSKSLFFVRLGALSSGVIIAYLSAEWASEVGGLA